MICGELVHLLFLVIGVWCADHQPGVCCCDSFLDNVVVDFSGAAVKPTLCSLLCRCGGVSIVSPSYIPCNGILYGIDVSPLACMVKQPLEIMARLRPQPQTADSAMSDSGCINSGVEHT